ncbi:MAG TPA: vWA domain-containing protein [Bacteriovoracaceae bacterium]|nr:vWA domain-containing protein [Bacteriovoracaceae bacterium]
MRKRRSIELFSISFLDLITGALGAVIILYVAIPKNHPVTPVADNSISDVLTKSLKNSQQEIRAMKIDLAAKTAELSALREKIPVAPAEYDVGFKFKGKKIVFLMDTSASMTEEDRMGQVKAGLKMLLTSLTGSYQFDVVQFPLAERAPFKSMWGTVRDSSAANKSEAFDFIYSIDPFGGTPTRAALEFVLSNYDGITDLVILSDGSPTLHNSNQKDDIYDILASVRKLNKSKVQINAIGVGSDFTKDKTVDKFKFLSQISSESGGFFVGF